MTPDQQPLRAATYARVSTSEQKESGYSLQSQAREMRALVAKQGYTLVAEFVDDHTGNELEERPDLNRLRDAVRAKQLDVLVIYESDRLSRRIAHQLLLEDEFRRANVRIEVRDVHARGLARGPAVGLREVRHR